MKHKIPIGDKQNHNTDRKQTGSVKRKIPIIEKNTQYHKRNNKTRLVKHNRKINK